MEQKIIIKCPKCSSTQIATNSTYLINTDTSILVECGNKNCGIFYKVYITGISVGKIE
jgi:uncharacterized Zn finger protein